MTEGPCVFCEIARGDAPAHVIEMNERACVFLDTRPLFRGHCLIVPKIHVETILDLPVDFVGPVMEEVQRAAAAVLRGLECEGTFVAINNRVSQSIPHLHVHVVPRRKKDGLKGFFWPRQRYPNEETMAQTANLIRKALPPRDTG